MGKHPFGTRYRALPPSRRYSDILAADDEDDFEIEQFLLGTDDKEGRRRAAR